MNGMIPATSTIAPTMPETAATASFAWGFFMMSPFNVQRLVRILKYKNHQGVRSASSQEAGSA
jgi:hypothetical protein